MKQKINKILAIIPGTKYLGLAVFFDTDLKDWAVKMVKGNKALGLIEKYFERYGIGFIALKRPDPRRSSDNLERIVDAIKRYVKTHGGCLYQYSLDEIEDTLIPVGKKNKEALSEQVGKEYPFLWGDIEQERKNKNQYLIKAFEAIGLGLRCLKDIDQKEKVEEKQE